MGEFKILFEFQKFDLSIDGLEEKIKQNLARVEKMTQEIKKEEDLLKNKEALLKKITLRRRKSEADLAEITDKIKTIELRMKSAGMAPDTYMAFQKEEETLKGKISALETQILEDMEKMDTLQKDTEKSTKVLGGRKVHLEEVKKKVAEQNVEMKKEKESVLTQKRQASMTIAAELLEKYEELRKRKNGQVVWDTDKPSCPACGMSFTPGYVRSLVGSEETEPCTNCGVLLHWCGIMDGALLTG